jgi:hypothetical protein
MNLLCDTHDLCSAGCVSVHYKILNNKNLGGYFYPVQFLTYIVTFLYFILHLCVNVAFEVAWNLQLSIEM